MRIIGKPKPCRYFKAVYDLTPPTAIGERLKCSFCGTKVEIENETEVEILFIPSGFHRSDCNGMHWRDGNGFYSIADSGWKIQCPCPNCGVGMVKRVTAKYEWREEKPRS